MSKQARRAAFYRRQRDARRLRSKKLWARPRTTSRSIALLTAVMMAVAPEAMQFWGDAP